MFGPYCNMFNTRPHCCHAGALSEDDVELLVASGVCCMLYAVPSPRPRPPLFKPSPSPHTRPRGMIVRLP